jgi:hypothetical protein
VDRLKRELPGLQDQVDRLNRELTTEKQRDFTLRYLHNTFILSNQIGKDIDVIM